MRVACSRMSSQWRVYVATAILLWEIPLMVAMALTVVVVVSVSGHGLEQDGDEVVGDVPFVV